MALLLTMLIILLSIIAPGLPLAFGMLNKTKLNAFEKGVIGFTFGLAFPPMMLWAESYFINYIHFFSFSTTLYFVDVFVLMIAGIILCLHENLINLDMVKPFLGMETGKSVKQQIKEETIEYKSRITELRHRIEMLKLDTTLLKKHKQEEDDLKKRQDRELSSATGLSEGERERILALHVTEERRLMEGHEKEERLILDATKHEDKKSNLAWYILAFLMLVTFLTRLMSIGISPSFFEFDPYFDMLSTQTILTHGYQLLYDHSAWPVIAAGSPHRIEPLVPYLEAFWYELTNQMNYHFTTLNTTLMSQVSSFYPPITAALLVFVVFMFLYHEFGDFPAIIGATLTAAMPALISTFMAGEQLLEPWGIFSLFFFYACYMLAVSDMKDRRLAILAGIAFVTTFFGAHYYTVDAGVLAIYIALQGMVMVFRRKDTLDFYKTNAIVIFIIALFFVPFETYESVLTNRIPALLGIPTLVAMPLFALLFVAIFEYVPKLAEKYKKIKKIDTYTYAYWLIGIAVVTTILMAFTSLGYPLQKYIQLSTHFTTPSIPLFMTVQEYAPTGFNFDFASAGFGIIGTQLFGTNILVWAVLIAFTLLTFAEIYFNDSKIGILSLSAVWPLAVAGMIEVKYLPHFGVGYILAIGIIIGELFMLTANGFSFVRKNSAHDKRHRDMTSYKAVYYTSIVVALLEALVFFSLLSAFLNSNCNSLVNGGNSIGYSMYCQVIPNSWLNATSWMRANVGPFAPRILSWWDYGDWINWFGNSNAVLRGDNAVATLDYSTAAHYVLSSKGFNATTLGTFMDTMQSKYVLFDDQLMQKWGALNFLACIGTNQTTMAFATAQGKLQSRPFVLGNSQCELSNSPVYMLVPVSASNINSYCSFNATNVTAVKALMLVGNRFENTTYCVSSSIFNSLNASQVYYSNGTKLNAIIIPTQTFFYGISPISGQNFANFLLLYTPNGPNDTVTNAPTSFYNSNFYRGFFFGKLQGFSLAYPRNFTGMNYVNSSNPVMILQLNNYTGGTPFVTQKYPWIDNNYSMPG